MTSTLTTITHALETLGKIQESNNETFAMIRNLMEQSDQMMDNLANRIATLEERLSILEDQG